MRCQQTFLSILVNKTLLPCGVLIPCLSSKKDCPSSRHSSISLSSQPNLGKSDSLLGILCQMKQGRNNFSADIVKLAWCGSLGWQVGCALTILPHLWEIQLGREATGQWKCKALGSSHGWNQVSPWTFQIFESIAPFSDYTSWSWIPLTSFFSFWNLKHMGIATS